MFLGIITGCSNILNRKSDTFFIQKIAAKTLIY